MTVDGTRHLAMRSIPTNSSVGRRRRRGADRRRWWRGDPATRSARRARREAISSASASARRARSTASTASCSSRRISAGRIFRCAIGSRTGCSCRRRSTTTRTARRSANGGRARRAAATNVIGMTIGTGIGGGLILDGALYHGASDMAGEIGHTTIDLNGRHCKCGNYGCLEAYASGPAIATRAREVLVREERRVGDAGDGGWASSRRSRRRPCTTRRRRATRWRARSCATRRATSARVSRTCSTSSIRTSSWSRAA